MAVAFLVNLEWFPILPEDKPFRAPGHMQTPYPDYRHYTARDYGTRVGVYRMLDAFAQAGVRASFAVNAAVAARYPGLIARIGLLDAAGVRFADNAFGIDVLAGKNPFGVSDAASLERYLATVFHDPAARPWMPWPAADIYIAQRRRDAAFEQRVLDRIGRGEERFLPGAEAANIGQPALLLWCRQDKVIDPSAMALYAARIPHASQVLLEGCGHMSLMERPGETAEAVAMLITRGAPGEPR